jgi:ATP-dependent protease ClpP protease subunit
VKKEMKYPPILNGPESVPQMDPAPKFWSIAEINENEAEIIMYGEIVSAKPVDWWTGEPLDGLFITPKDFLEDFARVKDKAKITVRINSVGGDTYTAIGIYNRLKEIKGEVVAVIEGIAASAATIIAMGCKTREIGKGALFMIHEASTYVRGSYYNHKALSEVENCLEAVNKAVSEIYNMATGLEIKEIREIMANETWYTGEEAVKTGFCTAVREELETSMCMGPEREEIIVNGIRHSISGFKHFPGSYAPAMFTNNTQSAAQPSQASQTAISSEDADINKNKIQEVKNNMTPEELRSAYPEAVASIEAAARNAATAEAVTAERTRLKEIEEIEATVGDQELITEAKYGEKACTAQELAFQAMKKQAQLGTQYLSDMKEDYKSSKANQVSTVPNAGNPLSGLDTKGEKEQITQLAALIASGGVIESEAKKGESK